MMVHLVPCRKNIIATRTTQLLWKTIIRYHGILWVIYLDRGAQFTAKNWQELCMIGTKLWYRTAYHHKTQGVVERMNVVVSQTFCYLIHDSQSVKNWKTLLPTMEMVINSLPHQSTRFSHFPLITDMNPGHQYSCWRAMRKQRQRVWPLSYGGSHPIGIWQRKIGSCQ